MSARLPLLRAGTQRKLAGQEGWLQHYQRAVEMCPTYAPAHYNLGGLRAPPSLRAAEQFVQPDVATAAATMHRYS